VLERWRPLITRASITQIRQAMKSNPSSAGQFSALPAVWKYNPALISTLADRILAPESYFTTPRKCGQK
jgi:hypothetical protein